MLNLEELNAYRPSQPDDVRPKPPAPFSFSAYLTLSNIIHVILFLIITSILIASSIHTNRIKNVISKNKEFGKTTLRELKSFGKELSDSLAKHEEHCADVDYLWNPFSMRLLDVLSDTQPHESGEFVVFTASF